MRILYARDAANPLTYLASDRTQETPMNKKGMQVSQKGRTERLGSNGGRQRSGTAAVDTL